MVVILDKIKFKDPKTGLAFESEDYTVKKIGRFHWAIVRAPSSHCTMTKMRA